MKSLKIIIVLTSLLLFSCYKKENNCTNFKTGKFIFTQEIDGKKHTTTFTRNEKYQIETYNGKTDTASLRWVSDCEFVLEKLHPKNMQEKKAISMRILTTKENAYTFEYSFVNDDNKQLGTVTKIN